MTEKIKRTFIDSIGVYRKHWTLFLLIGLVYLGAIGIGFLMYGFGPARSIYEGYGAMEEAAMSQNPVMNWLKEQVRKGGTGIIIAGLVISLWNLILADFLLMTLTGLFIVFPPFYISLTGWLQGLAFAAEGIPPLGSGFAYLEFFTYYLAAVAGTNIGLSILFPKRYDTDSRRTSFKSAWKETGYLYIWIAVILIVAGIWEAFYFSIYR